MKRLTVSFVGPVRRPGPQRTITVDPSGLATAGDLLLHLGYKDSEIAGLHVLAGGKRLAHSAPLDGVLAVEVLVAIGGG